MRRALLRPSLAWSRRLLHTTMDGATHEYGHVLKALAHYYNGLHNNDTTTMWKVWHPLAHLRRPSGDGAVVDIDADKFMTLVATPSRNNDNLERPQFLNDAVHTIDFATPSMAMVKLQVCLGNTLYTDLLAMLKLDDGWKIVSKLFAPRDASLPLAVDTTPIESSHAELGRFAAAYVDARRAADPRAMAALLHPGCSALTVRDGEAIEMPRDDFLSDLPIYAVGEAEESSLYARRFDRVVSIDKSGPDTACVKLHIGGNTMAGEDRLLIDYLMLIRVGGGWRLVSRVFGVADL